jgi:sodium transport system permease protein
MNWSNVLLILKREIRDQLRDRRTLFMIFVLPVLLYPLLGLTFIQLGQLAREEPTKVYVVGRENLPAEPALIEAKDHQPGRFIALASEPDLELELLDLEFPPRAAATPSDLQRQLAEGQERLRDGEFHTVLYFPPDFGQRLEQFRRRVSDAKASPAEIDVPKPEIFHNTAKRKSATTYGRVRRVLDAWREALVKQNLQAAGLPETAALPFRAETHDVAEAGLQFASIWSAAFPFMMLIWALTGAFYPAVDLCAGEKERGTLETLLSSPAERGEIVSGKLLTIMLFSMATVVLNLAAVGGTGWLVISQLPLGAQRAIGPPPPLAYLWVFLAMVPVAALFSALCLALAAFARSNKEGQYYLMPLFLVTLPLVLLPMQPSFELNLGNSLIPLTGIVLVLKAAIEGDYLEAARYFLPVTAVTAICCLLAIRWAIDQFNKESVLFRESERFSLGIWLRHLVRDRRETPTVAAAVMCGVLILAVKFFLEFTMVGGSGSLAMKIILPQLVCILAPALLMTAFLARSPRKTLLLCWPRWWTLPAAVALGIVMHPVAAQVSEAIQTLYPLDPRVQQAAEGIFGQIPLGMQFLAIALIGPVCEEIAFRGFILSGFRHLGRRWMAIVLSSVLFGLAHGIIQQSLLACLLGMLIAFVAVQTGSLLPAILYHVTHNGLMVGISWLTTWTNTPLGKNDPLPWPQQVGQWVLGTAKEPGWLYHWSSVALAAVLAALLLRAFARLPHEKTEEETLQEALGRQTLEQAPAA